MEETYHGKPNKLDLIMMIIRIISFELNYKVILILLLERCTAQMIYWVRERKKFNFNVMLHQLEQKQRVL